jgi:hypothetical protein
MKGGAQAAKLVVRRGRRRRVVVHIEIIASPAVTQGVGSGGSTGRGSHSSSSGLLSKNSSLQAGQ